MATTKKERKAKLKRFDDLEQENFDLVAKVVELINVIGWDDDDTYTFEDGERWAKFDPPKEMVKSHFKPSEVS